MFDRIIVVSLNPAIDQTIWLETMDLDEPNLVSRETSCASGKVENIARVLTSFDCPCTLLGVCGVDNFKNFSEMLASDGVAFDYLTVAGAIRENMSFILPNGKLFKVNRTGSAVPKEVLLVLAARIRAELTEGEKTLLVFAGRPPVGLSTADYCAWIDSLCGEDVSAALDVAAFSLEDICALRPFAIKPNVVELRRMSGEALETVESIAAAAKKLAEDVTHVLVSLGGEGLLYANENECVLVQVPQVEVRSTVGAGDTTFASFFYALKEGKTPIEAAKFAAAAGTASVTLEGTSAVTLDHVNAVEPNVTVQTIQ